MSVRAWQVKAALEAQQAALAQGMVIMLCAVAVGFVVCWHMQLGEASP